MFMVEWKPKEDGTLLRPCLVEKDELLNAFPLKIIEFYDKYLEF